MMNHIHKFVLEKNGKHGMSYAYWLNKVFDKICIIGENETQRTVLQMLGIKTLVKIIGVKLGSISQKKFYNEIEEVKLNLTAKN